MDDQEVSFLLVQAAKAHRSVVATALAELDLYIGQDLLLFQLWEEEGMAQHELADRLNVEPSAVTKMLKRMEAAGWIERRSDATDARVSRVFLTEQGRALEEPVRDIWCRTEAHMLDGFASEEKLLFRRMLRDIRDNLS